MDSPRLVVHESGRRWIEHLRMRMRGIPVRVHHTASRGDCLALIHQDGPCTLLVDMGHKPIESLEMIEEAGGRSRDLTIMVIASANLASLELATRELGALAFLCEPVTATEVADLVERVVQTQLALSRSTNRSKPPPCQQPE